MVKPKSEINYFSQEFNPTDILAYAVISDSTPGNLKSDVPDLNNEITNAIDNFIDGATASDGWIYPTNNNYLKKLPVVGIFNVALPNLPLDGTSSASGDDVGTQWLAYINSDSKYQNKLTKSDFLCREEFVN